MPTIYSSPLFKSADAAVFNSIKFIGNLGDQSWKFWENTQALPHLMSFQHPWLDAFTLGKSVFSTQLLLLQTLRRYNIVWKEGYPTSPTHIRWITLRPCSRQCNTFTRVRADGEIGASMIWSNPGGVNERKRHAIKYHFSSDLEPSQSKTSWREAMDTETQGLNKRLVHSSPIIPHNFINNLH